MHEMLSNKVLIAEQYLMRQDYERRKAESDNN